jgi:hypothetical protein
LPAFNHTGYCYEADAFGDNAIEIISIELHDGGGDIPYSRPISEHDIDPFSDPHYSHCKLINASHLSSRCKGAAIAHDHSDCLVTDCSCLPTGLVSVNPRYFDIRIFFIDEAIYCHADLFHRDLS